MGVRTDWYNQDKTIICYQFTGRWDWDEFYVGWEWVRQAMASVDHKVALIVDMQATRHIPVSSMVHLRAVVRRVNPNYAGVTVLVGTDSVGPAVSAVLYKMNPALREKYQALFADTLEEAEQMLADWRKQEESKVKSHDDHSGN
ncbi:MAG: hypothetical protein GC204_13920 [Chloroflexi bacterium]|nr:hypothetical protein [Chloroflexota bacterium]